MTNQRPIRPQKATTGRAQGSFSLHLVRAWSRRGSFSVMGGDFFSVPNCQNPFPARAESSRRLNFFDGPGENWHRNHLCDFLAGGDRRGVAQVGHQDQDFAAVAGVDDPGGGGDASGGHGGAVAHQQSEWLSGGRMAGFDGDAGADADCGARSEQLRLPAQTGRSRGLRRDGRRQARGRRGQEVLRGAWS